MERWSDSFHKKGKIYQQDIFSWCIKWRMKILDNILVLKPQYTCINQLASYIVFGCLSQSCCTDNS